MTAVGLIVAMSFGCEDNVVDPHPDLKGGVLATFQVEGDTFRFWTSNPATIGGLFALEDGESQASIPNGPLVSGPGQGYHNQPWGWHLDPDQTEMAENTIEVCSGLPSFVEENLADWMALGRYCPWSAVLTGLEDFR
jgi:hypothetical protein